MMTRIPSAFVFIKLNFKFITPSCVYVCSNGFVLQSGGRTVLAIYIPLKTYNISREARTLYDFNWISQNWLFSDKNSYECQDKGLALY